MTKKINAERVFATPIQRVWDVVSDHRGLDRWLLPGATIRLDPEGHSEPNGLGAVRVIERGSFRGEEKVVAYSPPHHLAYTVVSGAPIKKHLGEIFLEKVAEGTRVRWTVEFAPVVPGTGLVIAAIVRRVLKSGLERLETVL